MTDDLEMRLAQELCRAQWVHIRRACPCFDEAGDTCNGWRCYMHFAGAALAFLRAESLDE